MDASIKFGSNILLYMIINILLIGGIISVEASLQVFLSFSCQLGKNGFFFQIKLENMLERGLHPVNWEIVPLLPARLYSWICCEHKGNKDRSRENS